ncbi:MAG: Spy/CpxP family protein refolding chaperone [Ignavibacteriales bacterium]|nr:Spy/CpxP family protein refolding chaperone [Ignavibacteriales bacterium]
MRNLILGFVVLFAITIFNPQIYSQKRDHQRQNNFKMELKKQLNLTEEQEKKIESLRLSFEEKVIKFKSALELKELEMRKLKSSENLSRNDMINLTKEISAIRNDMALARTNHQMDVYELLDNAQRKVWMEKQENIGKMKNKMRDRKN